MTETQIKKYMSKGYTREEAIDLIKWDTETDKMTVGQINKEMTADERKAMKEATSTKGRVKENKPITFSTPKERKKDNVKVELLNKLADFLKTFVDNVEIPKLEKEITFKIGEDEYSLSLTKHRTSKK